MVSLDYLRKKHQELRGDAPANTDFLEKYLQLSVGPNDIRILPGADEQERFFAETKIHRIPQGNSVRNVHCLKTHNKPCPLCDAYFAIWKMHNSLNLAKGQRSKFSEMAMKIKPQPRFYMNALSRKTDEIKILSVGKKLMDKIIADLLELDESGVFMLDPQDGHDFKIEKTMNGDYPDYSKSSVKLKGSPLGSAKRIASFHSELHDIQGLVKDEDLSEVKALADEYMAIVTGASVRVESHEEEEDNPYLKSLNSGEDD
jgi:hypothetical protein